MERGVVWLLAIYAFVVPWEYSLDLGEPWGNVARIAGLALLAAAIPAVLRRVADGRVRRPGLVGVLTMALLVWFCLTAFWTVDEAATLEKLRGFFQEFLVVWVLGEFVESPEDWGVVVRAFVAGCAVLAVVTIGSFTSAEAVAAEQVRFSAEGQDPNDVARFLDLGFGLAAWMVATDRQKWARLLAGAYLGVGVLAVLLTASRGGFAGSAMALLGVLVLLLVWRRGVGLGLLVALGAGAVVVGLIVPEGTVERLMTIPEQLKTGDLNDRVNLWVAGWHAFAERPVAGWGAGTFTVASRLAPFDTAHNTMLSVMVTGGLVGASLLLGILVAAGYAVAQTRGLLRISLVTTLAVWVVTSMVATVEENRSTWLVLGLMAVAGRLAREQAEVAESVVPGRVAAGCVLMGGGG